MSVAECDINVSALANMFGSGAKLQKRKSCEDMFFNAATALPLKNRDEQAEQTERRASQVQFTEGLNATKFTIRLVFCKQKYFTE